MLGEVMEHYGITRSFRDAGYYETEHHRRVSQELDAAIRRGGLIALCGIVGCGKTILLARTREALQQEGEILAQELDIRQAEVRAFLRGTLPPGRTEEIHKQLLAKGIPA